MLDLPVMLSWVSLRGVLFLYEHGSELESSSDGRGALPVSNSFYMSSVPLYYRLGLRLPKIKSLTMEGLIYDLMHIEV